MANQETKQWFFVYVVESPSAVDLYHRRGEGEIIRQAVNLNGIACVVKTAISLEAFEASLKIGLQESMALFSNQIPILHISAHGFIEGIQLSNDEILEWRLLKELLRPINKALQGSLLVCMSSCEGYSGTRMAMHPEDDDLPFLALVGNAQRPTWADTAVAYTTFYHQLCKGQHITDATSAMCVASGDNQFFVEYAEQTRKGYLEYVNGISAQQAQAELQRQLELEPPDVLAKMRTLS